MTRPDECAATLPQNLTQALVDLRHAIYRAAQGHKPRTGEWIELQLPEPLFSIVKQALLEENPFVPMTADLRVADIHITRWAPR